MYILLIRILAHPNLTHGQSWHNKKIDWKDKKFWLVNNSQHNLDFHSFWIILNHWMICQMISYFKNIWYFKNRYSIQKNRTIVFAKLSFLIWFIIKYSSDQMSLDEHQKWIKKNDSFIFQILPSAIYWDDDDRIQRILYA